MASLESSQDKLSTNDPCTYRVLDEISCINHQLLAVDLRFPQPNKVSKHQPSVLFIFLFFFLWQDHYRCGITWEVRGGRSLQTRTSVTWPTDSHIALTCPASTEASPSRYKHTHAPQDLGLDLNLISFYTQRSRKWDSHDAKNGASSQVLIHAKLICFSVLSRLLPLLINSQWKH